MLWLYVWQTYTVFNRLNAGSQKFSQFSRKASFKPLEGVRLFQTSLKPALAAGHLVNL